MASSATPAADLMAAPAGGFGQAVPLLLYPPGFDLSRLVIFGPDGQPVDRRDPAIEAEIEAFFAPRPPPENGGTDGTGHGAGRSRPSDGPPGGPNGRQGPDPGFYRVFHIPDFTFNISSYT